MVFRSLVVVVVVAYGHCFRRLAKVCQIFSIDVFFRPEFYTRTYTDMKEAFFGDDSLMLSRLSFERTLV